MALCVLSCSALHISNSWRGTTLELNPQRRNWRWGVLRGQPQKHEYDNRYMRPSWRCLVVTSGAPGLSTLKGKMYLFIWNVNQTLFLVTNLNPSGQTKSVYPDHTSKPDLPDLTILLLLWQFQILPQLQMKSSHNFQHTTLRSIWIDTTSLWLMRHYATLLSGTLHASLIHLQRLALLYKQSPRRSVLFGLYKTGRTPLHLPTQALWITIGRRYWTLKTSSFAMTTLRYALRDTKRIWVVLVPNVPKVWPVKLGTNLTCKEIFSLENAGFRLPQWKEMIPSRIF